MEKTAKKLKEKEDDLRIVAYGIDTPAIEDTSIDMIDARFP